LRHGHGVFKRTSGAKYEGELKNDLSDGRAIFQYVNGDILEGGWKFGKKHGVGKYTTVAGKITTQEWENNRLIREY
jgi:hypothetical protein